jgi:UDP-N-acetyl-D-mannosaminuronic acid dehydrogenase
MSLRILVIGGLGHIGLPLSCLLAQHYKVGIYDTDVVKRDMFKLRCQASFFEPGLDDLIGIVIPNLTIERDISCVKEYNCIIITIGTPIDEYLNPQLRPIFQLFKSMMIYLNNDHIIILRSTVYPGTTIKLEQYLKSMGKEISIVFCPERVSGGNMIKELQTLPQIISMNNDKNFNIIYSMFLNICKRVIVLNNTTEGELCKLFTNTYRYINFAISNYFFMIAQDFDVDFYKLYTTMTDSYPRMEGFKKPGFTAGYCLRKDTLQLSSWNNLSRLGIEASLVNEHLPLYIFRKIRKKYGNLREKTVGILGMTFKANVDDIRDSLSFRLKKILENECKNVLCSDAFVRDEDFVTSLFLIENSDIIILGVPHNQYSLLEIEKPLVDIWNFYEKGVGL